MKAKLELHELDLLGAPYGSDAALSYAMKIYPEEGNIVVESSGPGEKLDEEVYRADMVPNFFIANAQKVRSFGGWDSRLKVAEHFEFFYRALGTLKVGLVTTVSAENYKGRPSRRYSEYRDRGKLFRQIALEKHGFRAFVQRKSRIRDNPSLPGSNTDGSS